MVDDIFVFELVVDEIGFFLSDMLFGMLSGFFFGDNYESLWFIVEDDIGVIGFCFVLFEVYIDGMWNMLVIVVWFEKQGIGVGGVIVVVLEKYL